MGIFGRLFGKKETDPGPGLEVLRVDMHSHLIPGIDDGSKSIEDSINMIRGLAKLGYTKLITTPHVMSDAYRNTPETILKGLEQVRKAIEEEGIEVELEAAAEYYLDEAFQEMIKSEELLSFGGEFRYVLFETSYTSRPLSLEQTIFDLQTAGYIPVLAHPERYQYFWEKEDVRPILDLRTRGARLQVNISSFAGTRGRRAAWIAEELAREGLIDFLGTDIHRMQQFEGIGRASELNRTLRSLLDAGTLLNTSLS